MNKTALVTGASAGLGADFAWLFAGAGHDVVIVARRRDRLEALAQDILAKHSSIRVVVVEEDLARPGAAKRIHDELEKQAITIDFLVNNAGFGGTGPFVDRNLAKEVAMVQVNIVALMELTHLLVPRMIANKGGRILNLGSTAGFVPGPFMAVYYASKAFVNSFTEALSVELAGTGVTATVACPGATATEFSRVAGNDNTPLFKKSVMTSREVAAESYRAMMDGSPMVVTGFMNKMRIASLRLAPRGMTRKIASNLNKSG